MIVLLNCCSTSLVNLSAAARSTVSSAYLFSCPSEICSLTVLLLPRGCCSRWHAFIRFLSYSDYMNKPKSKKTGEQSNNGRTDCMKDRAVGEFRNICAVSQKYSNLVATLFNTWGVNVWRRRKELYCVQTGSWGIIHMYVSWGIHW